MKKNRPTHGSRSSSAIIDLLCALLLFSGFLCLFSALWYIRVYGDMGFASVIYTLTVNLGGVQSGLVTEFLLGAVLPTIIATALACAILFWQPPRRLIMTLWQRIRIQLYPCGKFLRSLYAGLLSILLIVCAALLVRLPEYIANQRDQSILYDTVYVDPASTDIQFPAEKKNLIYIFMESMETSFFSQEEGGGLPYNCIPELYRLAAENINFSTNGSVGGIIPSSLANWTIAAMVGQTSGLPLVTPP